MDIQELITNLGFPAAVAAFALWNSYKHEEYLQNTLTGTVKENTKAIRALTEIIGEKLHVAREVNDNEI